MKLGAIAVALVLATAACGGLRLASNRDRLPPTVGLPPGELLLATGGSAAALYSAALGERSLGDVYPFDLAPDGTSVLAARSEQEPSGITRRPELLRFDVASGTGDPILRATDRETLGPAQWSPDGSQIAYRLTTFEMDSSEVHVEERSTDAVCVRSVSGSQDRCFDHPGAVYTFDWSPEGRNLLVAGSGSDPVFSLDVSTGATGVVISPGGDEALGAELERLGYGEPVQFVFPQWSASGRYVAALVSLVGGSRSYVPAVFTAAGAFVSLAEASGEFPDAFGWAPDRDLLAYTKGEAPYRITELYVHDPATASDQLLSTTEDEGPVIPRIDGLAWSPDGRWIAFSRPKGVRLVDVEGEEASRELDVRGTVVDWAPGPLEPTPTESEVRLPPSSDIVEIPFEDDTLVTQVAVGEGAVWAGLAEEDGAGAVSLVRIDPSTNQVTTVTPMGQEHLASGGR